MVSGMTDDAERQLTLTVSPEEALAYLDNAIRKWRENRDDAIEGWANPDLIRAEAYVDAFQSVRLSLFGELLPVEGTED